MVSDKASRPATWAWMALVVLQAGCASSHSADALPLAHAPIANQWHAPLPHAGQVGQLHDWWRQFDDPLLLRLVEAGQHASPTVAQARARMADARALRVERRADLLPSLVASASAGRGKTLVDAPIDTASSVGMQASWEIDLFGAGHAAASAAASRLQASEAGWHDARISIAAEVATVYVEVRACEAQERQAVLEVDSRAETARITRLSHAAGFSPRSSLDHANASAAESRIVLARRSMECDLLIKALTALTAENEAALRRELASATGLLPRPAALQVANVPADSIAQRPDVHVAATELMAAGADLEQARAQRWPRIELAGTIEATRAGSVDISISGTAWRVGPVIVTLPLFDGGARRANLGAAGVRLDAARTTYLARLRDAVREVEAALVGLDSTRARATDARIAASAYEGAFVATEASYQAGSLSLFELEDTRRSMVAARVAVIDIDREHVVAWISLYRALGGGWSPSTPADIPR